MTKKKKKNKKKKKMSVVRGRGRGGGGGGGGGVMGPMYWTNGVIHRTGTTCLSPRIRPGFLLWFWLVPVTCKGGTLFV